MSTVSSELRPSERRNRPLAIDGVISLLAAFLAFAALDDITTDASTDFSAEYVTLVACATWFSVVAVKLLRRAPQSGQGPSDG